MIQANSSLFTWISLICFELIYADNYFNVLLLLFCLEKEALSTLPDSPHLFLLEFLYFSRWKNDNECSSCIVFGGGGVAEGAGMYALIKARLVMEKFFLFCNLPCVWTNFSDVTLNTSLLIFFECIRTPLMARWCMFKSQVKSETRTFKFIST